MMARDNLPAWLCAIVTVVLVAAVMASGLHGVGVRTEHLKVVVAPAGPTGPTRPATIPAAPDSPGAAAHRF